MPLAEEWGLGRGIAHFGRATFVTNWEQLVCETREGNQVPTTVINHANPTFAEAIFSGDVSPQELQAAATETVALAYVRSPALMLADLSELEGGHTVDDLLELSRGFVWRPGTLEAIVFPHALSAAVMQRIRAWAKSSAANGLTVRLFETRGRALDWLLGPDREESPQTQSRGRH